MAEASLGGGGGNRCLSAARDALEAARRLIRSEGWVQGELHILGRGYCITGALAACTDEGAVRDDAMEFVRQAIGAPVIVTWNDDLRRVKGDIDRALTQAMKIAARTP